MNDISVISVIFNLFMNNIYLIFFGLVCIGNFHTLLSLFYLYILSYYTSNNLDHTFYVNN